jgi:2-aminobenzoate-CoA ligase
MVDHRPPRELWPDLIYTLPELQYPDRLNLATELVDRHVESGAGDAVAIVTPARSLTYGDLQRDVNRIGNALLGLGVQPGDRVLLRMPNRAEFAAAWLAVQKIGAVSVSTMPMLRARELAYIISDAEAALAVVAGDLIEELEQAKERTAGPLRIVTVGPLGEASRGRCESLESLAGSASGELAAYPTGRDAPALIAYTSGSTGTPKGACHAPSDILASADTYGRYILAPTSADIFGGHPTLAFTYGLGGILVCPLRFGARTVLTDRFSPEGLMETVAREKVTLLFCAATTYRMLLQIEDLERRFDLGSLRLCVSAGEPLPAPVYEEWMRRVGVEILDSLGTTEMFHVFVCQRPGETRPGATGLPVPGYEVRVVDENLQEVPAGTPGLLAVRGPTGCRYWKKPDRQREYVRGGWNIPNDVCVRDADGYFYYQCRNDDLIICAGYNIAAPEIESVLLEHPAVLEAAVVASPDAAKGFVPAAYVVLKSGAAAGDELTTALQEHVRRELAPYKYPRRIRFVDALPKTETGKIRRVVLRDREAAAG